MIGLEILCQNQEEAKDYFTMGYFPLHVEKNNYLITEDAIRIYHCTKFSVLMLAT